MPRSVLGVGVRRVSDCCGLFGGYSWASEAVAESCCVYVKLLRGCLGNLLTLRTDTGDDPGVSGLCAAMMSLDLFVYLKAHFCAWCLHRDV